MKSPAKIYRTKFALPNKSAPPSEMTLNYSIMLMTVICTFGSVTAIANEGDSRKFVGVGITDSKGASIGLKFAPPDEVGWSTENTGLNLVLRKNADSDSDNREIEAYLIKLDSPISPISDYIKTIRRNLVEGYANSKKFKISALELSEDTKDSRCVRGYLLLEAIQPDQSVQEKRWSEQYFLSCGLLKHKGLGFELRYYHRYLDSKKDKQFIEDARLLLESAKIDGN
jgi:hypothetical protein